MKESSSRESYKKEKREIDEEILYEKLLIIGDKNVGKFSLIQNIFSEDSNIIISENTNNNTNIENNSNKKNEVNQNNNNSNKEEKKDNENKEENENNKDKNNNSIIKKEEKNEGKNEKDGKDNIDNINNNNINKKEVQYIIYEKKMPMKNSTHKIKYFQIFITSFCDNNLIHSLGYMCQCILVLFDVKNKISFENAKKKIDIMNIELKNTKSKVILVSTKNDQDGQDKEKDKENNYISTEEVNKFLNEIKEKNNEDNKYRITLNNYIEISNSTKRGINNLRTEILNSYEKTVIIHTPLILGINPDFFRLKTDDIYDKYNTISTNYKSINNNNNINNQDSYIETVSPKYIFKLENIKNFKKATEEDIYENIKIILIGDTQVGKTSFLNQFFSEGFNSNLTSTIGIIERSKILCYENKKYKIQIWDTAGQERFESIPKQYYEKIEGVFLFYDVTNERSFDNTIKWLKDIMEGGHKDLIVYILGNKVDLINERKVSYETGLSFAKNKNIKFMEISCKLDLNIRDVIYCMIYDIFKIENHCDFSPTKSFSLGKSSFNSKSSKRNNSKNNNKQNYFRHGINNDNNNEQLGCCF